MHASLQYRLEPKRIVTYLSVIAGILLVVHMFAAYAWAKGDWFIFTERDWVSYNHVKLLDLDEEAGFGTWFAAVILLFSGRLLLIITRDSRRARDGVWGWWLILAIGFHCLSVDEVACIHEYVNTFRNDFGWVDVNWTYYAAVVVVALYALFIPFFLLLGRAGHIRTVALLVIAGVVYVGGAVAVEELGPDHHLDAMAYNLGWITLEEGLEMAGIILLIYTLLDYLRAGKQNQIIVEVGPRPAQSEEAS